MKIKYLIMFLVSLKAYCAINDTNVNTININNFDTFEITPHLNSNPIKEYSHNLSNYFRNQPLLTPPKYANNDPIFDGHDIYYKDNSKLNTLLTHYKNNSKNIKCIDTIIKVILFLTPFTIGWIVL